MKRAGPGSLLAAWIVCFSCLGGIVAGESGAEEPPALAWEARYNRPYSEDRAVAVVSDPAGNLYVTGSGWGRLGSLDFWTVKYDPSGRELWKVTDATYSYSFECQPLFADVRDVPVTLALDGAGDLYVAGNAGFTIRCGLHDVVTSMDAVIVKYGPDGTRLWAIQGWPGDEIADLVVDGEGNVYVTSTDYECYP